MKNVSMIVLAICSLVGCSAARVVRETKTGGEIALLGDREEARQKANAMMAAKCQAGYEVDEEGDVVVGQETQARSDQYSRNRSSGWGRPSSTTTTSATSRDVTEWRILYHCKGTEAPAAPAPASAPQTSARHELILRF